MRWVGALLVVALGCGGAATAASSETVAESDSEAEPEDRSSELGSRESDSALESDSASESGSESESASASASESASESASASASESESESESESASASASESAASEPPSECSTWRECTLLTDSCGNPHGAPNGSPPLPTRGRICPPNDDPPREPVCRHGQCQTQEASYPDVRGCNADGDCVVSHAACGEAVAVNRTQQGTFEREQRAMASRIRCRQPPPDPPNLRAACLVSLCALR